MNIILMTVLLTLFGTGLVVLLVWLSVVSWKSMKFKKKAKKQIINLARNSEESVTNIYTYIDDYKNSTATRFDEVYQQISLNDDNIYNYTKSEISSLNNKLANLDSAIDSRFDKMHNLIKDKNEKK